MTSSSGHFSSSGYNNGSSSFTSSSSSSSSNYSGFPSLGSFDASPLQSQHSYTSNTSSCIMTDSGKAYYITSVANGHVLARKGDNRPSGVVAENPGTQGNEERWSIEAGDEPNVIALKNAASGQYLHTDGPNRSGATVGTGEKQWWKISNDNVNAPGACSLSPLQYPDVFLNHFQGIPVKKGAVGMKVHMWRWEAHVPYWLSWYFMDADGVFNPLVSSGAAGASKADFDSKLKALEERENTLTKKDDDRSTEWDKKMKEVQDLQASSAQDEKDRTASYDQKLKDLQAREDALANQKEQDQSSKAASDKDSSQKANEAQAKKDADLQRKLDDLSSAQQKNAADRAALEKSKSDLAAKEKELRQRQKELEDQKQASQNGQNAPNGAVKSPLEKKQKGNTALEQRLAKLEDQLSQMKTSPNGAAGKSSQANGKANGKANGSAPGDASAPGCGYKHHKPPRKLNRKVIGIVYQ